MGTPNGVTCPGLDRLRSSYPTVSPKPLREVVDYKLDQCGTDLLSVFFCPCQGSAFFVSENAMNMKQFIQIYAETVGL